jgi:hypothetical protein
MPQVWYLPEEMEMNRPVGGLLWPELFEPQQSSVPLLLIPQVCSVLTEID